MQYMYLKLRLIELSLRLMSFGNWNITWTQVVGVQRKLSLITFSRHVATSELPGSPFKGRNPKD